jgi:hypothetical protein
MFNLPANGVVYDWYFIIIPDENIDHVNYIA